MKSGVYKYFTYLMMHFWFVGCTPRETTMRQIYVPMHVRGNGINLAREGFFGWDHPALVWFDIFLCDLRQWHLLAFNVKPRFFFFSLSVLMNAVSVKAPD